MIGEQVCTWGAHGGDHVPSVVKKSLCNGEAEAGRAAGNEDLGHSSLSPGETDTKMDDSGWTFYIQKSKFI